MVLQDMTDTEFKGYSQLQKFLQRHGDLPENQLKEFLFRFRRKEIKKNGFLFREGEVCKDLVFVYKGCLRLYYIKEGIDISVWFAFENSSAIDVSSFISAAPSNYFLQAIEDSEILYLSKNEIESFYDKYPKIEAVMRNYWEDAILQLIKRFTSLQTESAEKRYLNLIAKGKYMQKIPQKYLASFIGVTPTSLSRIRKNLSGSDKLS